MDELWATAARRNDHADGKHLDRPDRGCDRCNPWDQDDDED